MKIVSYSTQFKKDYKRIQNDLKKKAMLFEVLEMLRNEEIMPAKYQLHQLQGKYKGCMECHLGNDFLLIWFDTEKDIIRLLRLGSHSELFRR